MNIETLIREIVKDEINKLTGDVAAQPATEPAKRGRGRPARGEETASAPTAVATETADPFADPETTKPGVPEATLQNVRDALTGLKVATSQENALKVLKDSSGAGNLTELKPEKYDAVVAAVQLALQPATKPVVEEDDPFAEPAAAPQKAYTLEDVKAAATSATKRSGADRAQKVVMEHGGKAPIAGGANGPSLKALPEAQYGAVIAALNAIPTTK